MTDKNSELKYSKTYVFNPYLHSDLWTIVKNVSRYQDGSYEVTAVEKLTDLFNSMLSAHTNAEIAKAVKEAKPFPVGGSEFADGYMAGIKQYETNLMKFIERAKLKEVK